MIIVGNFGRRIRFSSVRLVDAFGGITNWIATGITMSLEMMGLCEIDLEFNYAIHIGNNGTAIDSMFILIRNYIIGEGNILCIMSQ